MKKLAIAFTLVLATLILATNSGQLQPLVSTIAAIFPFADKVDSIRLHTENKLSVMTTGNKKYEIDFDHLRQAGSMLGSGALFVVAEGTDMLALATNVVRFFRNESCGKCVPCRVGSEKAVNMLEDILDRGGTRNQLHLLEELADTLQQTSICGLGQVAINPILSVARHFPDDVSQHVRES